MDELREFKGSRSQGIERNIKECRRFKCTYPERGEELILEGAVNHAVKHAP